MVVAIDQFEETWTACTDDGERKQFLDTVSELATDPRSSVSLVIAVRADFVGHLAEHEALRSLVRDGTVLRVATGRRSASTCPVDGHRSPRPPTSWTRPSVPTAPPPNVACTSS